MLACLAPLDKYYEDDQHSLLMKNAAQVAWVYHSKLLHLFHTCICLKFYAWLYLVLLGFCKLHWHVQHLMWSHCEDNLSTLQYAAQVCLGIAWSRCASKTAQNTCEMTTLEYDQTKKRNAENFCFQHGNSQQPWPNPEYIVELVSLIFYYHWNMWFLKCVSNRAPQKTPMDLVFVRLRWSKRASHQCGS